MLFSRKPSSLYGVPLYARIPWQTWGRYLMLGIVLLSVWQAGCQQMAEYHPNDKLVTTMGLPQARKRLEEVLLRSTNPPINLVEITDDFVRVDLTNTTYQVRVFFKDIRRVEVFNNNVVLVWGEGQRLLFRPLFPEAQNAKIFGDLMLSLRKL